MRAKHSIDGGICGDACVGFCCPCCGLAQMMHQMETHAMAIDDKVITSQPKSIRIAETDEESDTDVVCKQPC